ncbi:MAG: glycosyltransferase family 9 protein [Proteobacteria bacterium]|nr:glycosyltransferase family 9 protein [Pseudomonadota bacterium]
MSGKILIIHQGAIGDLILSLPAITAIREYFPHLSFHIMGHPSRLELLPVEPEQIVSIDMPGLSSFYTTKPDPPKKLSQYLGKFEKVIIFGEKAEEALLNGMKMAGITEILRIDTSPDRDIHATDHQASVLSSAGIEVKERTPLIHIAHEDARLADEVLLSHNLEMNDRIIFLHPGSGSIKKSWSPVSFALLAQYLQDRLNMKIVIIEGPADGAQVEEFYRHFNSGSTVRIVSPSLRTLAAILKRGKCFAGSDSGITHLSAAVGTPTVALFGPTDPGVWGPRGGNVHIITETVDCSPCSQETFKACARQRCLENIRVETVYHVIQGILDNS